MPKEKENADQVEIKRLYDTFHREHQTAMKFLSDCQRKLEETLSQNKMQSLQTKLKETMGDIEQMLDRKMHHMNLMKTEYDTCEEQYQRRLQKHCDLIEYFINAHKLFAKRIEQSYENMCTQMISDYGAEVEFRRRYDEQQQTNFANMHDANNLWTEHKLDEIDQELVAKKYDLAKRSMIKQEDCGRHATEYMAKLQKQIADVLEVMKIDFGLDVIEKEFPKMYEDDAAVCEDIKKLQTQIDKKRNVLMQLDKELRVLQHQKSVEIKELDDQKAAVFRDVQSLKREKNAMERNFKELLKYLAIKANNVSQNLEARLRKVEHLVGVHDACRRYQTENEKALGLRAYADSLHQTDESEPDLLCSEATIIAKIAGMINMENYELNAEKRKLTADNDALRDDIRAYCELQKYNQAIANLRLSDKVPVGVPRQEVCEMNLPKNIEKHDLD